MKNIDFYFFSGTGNTKRVADEMSAFFREHHCKVHLYPIEKNNKPAIAFDHLIGLAFPVAVFSSYPFVWDFFKALPETPDQTPIFMVDTLAGKSGGIVNPLYHLLKRKGYKPVAAKEIIMPSNWNFKSFSEEKNDRIRTKGLQKARRYAHDILFGKARWHHHPLPNLLQYFARSNKPWKTMRSMFALQINTSACIKCGICYQLCPVENIKMEHYPEFQDKCQLCMRCISFCPTRAIFSEKRKFYPYQAVKNEKELIGG